MKKTMKRKDRVSKQTWRGDAQKPGRVDELVIMVKPS